MLDLLIKKKRMGSPIEPVSKPAKRLLNTVSL